MADLPAPPPEADAEPVAQTYPDAPDSLIESWMARRKRMAFGKGEGLPPVDADLAALLEARIPSNEPKPEGRRSLHGLKLHDIRSELAGKSELAALNGILIAHLRKQAYPAHAPALFRRIWAEAGPQLMQELPGRWLISSVITFGDHGETEAQRRIGLAMNVLFSVMKLYEYERFHSGTAPDKAFPLRRVARRRLPMGMPQFALLGGGLDINLLAQVWTEAGTDPVAGALARHLLHRLNDDPANLFRRIALMRAEKQMTRLDDALTRAAPPADLPDQNP